MPATLPAPALTVRRKAPLCCSVRHLLPRTLVDWWRMIWQERVPLVVMLTKPEERNQNKSIVYWSAGIPHNYKGFPWHNYGDVFISSSIPGEPQGDVQPTHMLLHHYETHYQQQCAAGHEALMCASSSTGWP